MLLKTHIHHTRLRHVAHCLSSTERAQKRLKLFVNGNGSMQTQVGGSSSKVNISFSLSFKVYVYSTIIILQTLNGLFFLFNVFSFLVRRFS